MTNDRFKIDYSGYLSGIFGLYIKEPKQFMRSQTWRMVDYSNDRSKMEALYGTIKDLPEYLP